MSWNLRLLLSLSLLVRLLLRLSYWWSSLACHCGVPLTFLFIHLLYFNSSIFILNIFYEFLVLLVPFDHNSVDLLGLVFILSKGIEGIFVYLRSFLKILLMLICLWIRLFEWRLRFLFFRTYWLLVLISYLERLIFFKYDVIFSILLSYKFCNIFLLVFIVFAHIFFISHRVL